MGRCQALLKKNNSQCKNKSKPNCKLCGIHIKSKNVKLIESIFSLKSIIMIQSLFKGYKQRLINNLRGPALKLKNRKDANNETDFMSLENIEDIECNKFFSYKDKDGFIYAFNIDSIHELIQYTEVNPYNRKEFPKEIIQNIQTIYKFVPKNNKTNVKQITFKENPEIFIKTKCVSIFQRLDDLEMYTQPRWFLDLSINNLKRYYYELLDIWHYRAMLSKEIKKNHIKYENGKLFKFNYNYIKMITNKYVLQDIILDIFHRLSFEGNTRDNCVTSCYWILSALVLLSNDAAAGYPHLVHSVM